MRAGWHRSMQSTPTVRHRGTGVSCPWAACKVGVIASALGNRSYWEARGELLGSMDARQESGLALCQVRHPPIPAWVRRFPVTQVLFPSNSQKQPTSPEQQPNGSGAACYPPLAAAAERWEDGPALLSLCRFTRQSSDLTASSALVSRQSQKNPTHFSYSPFSLTAIKCS